MNTRAWNICATIDARTRTGADQSWQGRPSQAMAETAKPKAIKNAISQIEKQFGKGSIMKLCEAEQRMAVEIIPTGSIALDIALGVGGIPRGRVTEIFGPEASGKTTIVQHII